MLKLKSGGHQATWWMQRPGGNAYWRCEVPAKKLPGQVLALRFDDLKYDDDGSISMPRQEGVAIWSYVGNATRGILMAAQQEAGCKVLMEVDDNYLLSTPQIPFGRTEWRKQVDVKTDFSSHDAHRRLASFADGIIVTTEELAKAYREVNARVYVCRNSVDLEDWPEPEKPNDGTLRIGYAASHSHYFDAADIRRAMSWASDQKDVDVFVYGLDPHWSFRYLQVAWTQDLAEYRKSLQILDVGLCPLRANAWANCKSDIKAMEYCMSGALPIVSSTVPYNEWQPPFWDNVADTPKDFLKQLKWVNANRDAIPELVARARTYVEQNRTIDIEIDRWREAIA